MVWAAGAADKPGRGVATDMTRASGLVGRVTMLVALVVGGGSAVAWASPPSSPVPERSGGVGQPGGAVAAPGRPADIAVVAVVVDDPMARPEGPGPPAPGLAAPAGHTGQAPVTGEGLFWLEMAAPGTSWASPTDTSVVVDVTVDGGRPQQVVLFDGAQPFTYTGFVGPLATGPHILTVTVDRALSHTATGAHVRILQADVGVVPTASPDYLMEAYAPVIYGRTSAASRYTPLLVDAAEARAADGDATVDYVLVVSAHDQGDSLVPAYQWALWGRMTDIVSVVQETVAPSGAVLHASFASCGCESIPGFPDWVMAPEETTAEIPAGDFDGHHPVLRDASATNYLSDVGISPFRFAQAPVAAPPPGRDRTAVMDEHPWTYRISNEELPREHLISTDPDNLVVGDYRQYAIVDSDIDQHGVQDIQFDIKLAGDPTWYSTDYRQMTLGVPSTVPFRDGGHTRMAVKLPLDWSHRAIVGFRVRLETDVGAAGPVTARILRLRVLEVSPTWQVVVRRLPPVRVVRSLSLEPVGLPG